MKLFKVNTVSEAQEKLKDEFKNFKIAIEKVDITKALGRILAEDVFATNNVPHFRRSTVDGYAVYSKDTFGATESLPAFLKNIGEVHMGKPAEVSINPDEAVYVPTGGMIPKGADSVVMIEYTEKISDDELAIYRPVVPRENMIDIGDDIEKDMKVLKRGMKLRPQDIGVLSSIGIDQVQVYEKPRFAIISTGDEIISPNEKLRPGVIRDINTYTLTSMAEDIGGIVTTKIVVRDKFEDLKNIVERAIDENHIVILSGGSSVGIKDMTGKIINDIGEPGVFVHGLAIKPGKPTILSKVKDKPVFGLPGQPVSAMVVFKVIVEHFVKYILDLERGYESFIQAKTEVNIHSAQGKETYQMVTIQKTDNGYIAKPIYGKSGMITLMSKAQGYIKIDIDREGIKKGEKVKVYLLR